MFSNTHKHSSETFRKEQTSTWSTWSNQHNALSNSRALDHNRNDFESGSSPFQIKKDTKTHNGDGQSKIEIATALPAHRYDSSPRSGFSTDFQPTPVGVLSSTLENKDTQGTSAIAASYQSSSPKASSQPLKEQLSIWTSPITRQPRKHGWMSLVNSDSTFMQSASKLSSSTNHTCSATSWSVEKNQMEAISGSISSDSSVVVRSFLKRNSHLVYKESKSQQWNSVIGSKHRIRPDLKSPNDNKPSNIHPQLDSTRVHLPKIAHTSVESQISTEFQPNDSYFSSNKTEQPEKSLNETVSSITKIDKDPVSIENTLLEKTTVNLQSSHQEGDTIAKKDRLKFEEVVQKEVDTRLKAKQADFEKERKRLAAKAERLITLEAALKQEESRLKELEEQLKNRERLLKKALIVPNTEAQLYAEQQQELNRIKNELVAKKKHEETNDTVHKKRVFRNIQDFSKFEYPESAILPNISEGKIKYDISFMKLFIGLCTATNANLSLLQSTFGSKSEYQTIATNTSRDKYSNYNSVSNLHDTGKFNSNSRSSGFYGSSFGATFERPSSNYNNGTKFRPNTYIPHPPMPEYIPPVAPLKKSENRWVPASSKQSPSDIAIDGILPEDIIIRKTKALLNKLTMEKFESISGQIFEYCQQSKIENDGKALRTVIRLTFEKACDEPAFSAMWAKLCQSMRDRMTDDIVDKTLKDKNDMPISGVLLFRTYLFDRCQQEFESGWKTKMPDLAAGEMLTDEYYAAAKAKRQGLGLIQLIGELYKLSMLSDKVIYSCLVKLCDDPNNAEDEDVESLCRLLSTVGKTLDSKPKTSPWLDEFIGRIQGEMSASEKLTSRAKFMILDLAELRSNQWVPHSGVKPSEPTTLSEVREQVDKASSTRKSFRF